MYEIEFYADERGSKRENEKAKRELEDYIRRDKADE